PDEKRQECRNGERDDEQRPVRPLQRETWFVECDREQQAKCERDENNRRREDERPDEHLEERTPDQRAVNDPAEVARADIRFPAGLELLAVCSHERTPAIVVEGDSVLEPDEGVTMRVVAQRRLQDDRRVESLRLDRLAAADWDGERRQLRV